MERNLAAFLAVARHRSLTRASEILNVTQPSVSKRISNIEAEFGAPLFERDRYGMTLTEAGHVVMDHARRIEDEYRFCREALRSIGSASLSSLRVGAGPLFHLSCVASLFTELKSRFPDLSLELVTDVHRDAGEALIDGQLDMYLGVIDAQGPGDGITSKIVAEVEHGIVMRPDHPMAAQDRVDVSRLGGQQWVIFGIDNETEGRIKALTSPGACRGDLIDIRTASFATGLQLVKDGPFIMSAPLQLSRRVRSEGLVIKPTLQGMPKRGAGLHIRQSAREFGAIQASLQFFESFQF